MKPKSLSNEELLSILKNEYEENGEPSISRFLRKNGLPNYGVYLKRFGSWNKAKELANIPVNNASTLRITKEQVKESFMSVVSRLGHVPTLKELENDKLFPSVSLIYREFKTYDEFICSLGIEHVTENNGKYKKEYLINSIKRFVQEFGRIPLPRDFNKLDGYPTRKTFTNHFYSFNEVVILAGYEPAYESQREISEKYTPEFLINELHRYVVEFNENPSSRAIDASKTYPSSQYYEKAFGSWNNALTLAGLEHNSVSEYDNDFLESEFRRFVKTHGRIPRLHEFNNGEYPSFWCYQNRFGSWNKAVVNYGYVPNDENRKHIMDDGEICASSYEFDVSTFLKNNNIMYDRNIKYDTFISNYKGKMDCDYVIKHEGKTHYVEVAGFLSSRKKMGRQEEIYYFKLQYKIKLLKRENLNFYIITVEDLKKRTMVDIFSFILDKKNISDV